MDFVTLTDRNMPVGSPATRIAVAVVEHHNQFLVGLRPRQGEGGRVPLAGCWEFPGGKIEADEDPRAAAARECLEETGLRITIRDAYPTIRHHYRHGTLELNFFAATPLDPQLTPQSPFRWTPRQELAQLKFPPANATRIEILTDATTGQRLRP